MENSLLTGVHCLLQRKIQMEEKIMFWLEQIMTQESDTFLRRRIILAQNQLIELNQLSHRELYNLASKEMILRHTIRWHTTISSIKEKITNFHSKISTEWKQSTSSLDSQVLFYIYLGNNYNLHSSEYGKKQGERGQLSKETLSKMKNTNIVLETVPTGMNLDTTSYKAAYPYKINENYWFTEWLIDCIFFIM